MTKNTDAAKSAVAEAIPAAGSSGAGLSDGIMGGLVLPSIAIASVPLALAIGAVWIFGKATDSLQDSKARANALEESMPDQWLQQVAEAKDASQEGLAFLAKCIAENGVVTVAQAAKWVEIEENAHPNTGLKAKVLAAPGATALLARAHVECGALLVPTVLDAATAAVKKSGAFGTELVSRITTRLTPVKSEK